MLDIEHYYDLLTFLPWDNHYHVYVVMLTSVQAPGKVLTDVPQIKYLLSIITPLTRNTETTGSVIDGDGGAVHITTNLVGTLGIKIGTVESFNGTSDLAAATAEGVNSTNITPFYSAFYEEQVIVANIVHLLIHENTDIGYQMLVVPREHLSFDFF